MLKKLSFSIKQEGKIHNNNYRLSFINRMRALEKRIQVKRELKKEIKKQGYRAFLQDPPRPLPSYNALCKWRKCFLLIGVIFLTIPAVEILLFYDQVYYVPPSTYKQSITPELKKTYSLEEVKHGILRSIPFFCGFLFFMFTAFGMAVDWTIYRRWGKNKKTIIVW